MRNFILRFIFPSKINSVMDKLYETSLHYRKITKGINISDNSWCDNCLNYKKIQNNECQICFDANLLHSNRKYQFDIYKFRVEMGDIPKTQLCSMCGYGEQFGYGFYPDLCFECFRIM